MLPDEQIYPIEKSTDLDPPWTLSALQISTLLRASDHEALFAAATDYTATAEHLDRTADTIRRGATNLAAAWRGHAARDSLNHLRQYYASARSLAADCRASAAALIIAATALAEARARAALLPGGDFPSPDPASLQSLEYQKVLANLNAAYNEAITQAPNQLAIALPPSGAYDVDSGAWDGPSRAKSTGRSDSPLGGGVPVGGPPGRPQRLVPIVPPNPPHPDVDHARPALPRNDDHLRKPRNTDGVLSDGGRHGPLERVDHSRVPFMPETNLAGGGDTFGGSGTRVPAPGGPPGLPDRGIGSGAIGDVSRPGAAPLGKAAPAAAGGAPGGIIPGHGRSTEESERERRYYLLEDPDIWGTAEAVPSVLYGEHQPPRPSLDDDDDDDF